jgi:hypothetical protein
VFDLILAAPIQGHTATILVRELEHDRPRKLVVAPPRDEPRPYGVVQDVLDGVLEPLIAAKKVIPEAGRPERALDPEPPRFNAAPGS